MESQRCVPRSRDEHKAIRSARESAMAISRPLLTVFTCTYRKVTQHGDQEQELKEEHGEEASSEDAEGEATGKEGQEVDAGARARLEAPPSRYRGAGRVRRARSRSRRRRNPTKWRGRRPATRRSASTSRKPASRSQPGSG